MKEPPEQDARRIRLVINQRTKRPACALLQAACGGDYDALSRLWPSIYWEDIPSVNFVMASGTEMQWKDVIGRLKTGALTG